MALVRDKGDLPACGHAQAGAEIRDTIKLRQTRPFVAKDQAYLNFFMPINGNIPFCRGNDYGLA